jgi:hypothetical protein
MPSSNPIRKATKYSWKEILIAKYPLIASTLRHFLFLLPIIIRQSQSFSFKLKENQAIFKHKMTKQNSLSSCSWKLCTGCFMKTAKHATCPNKNVGLPFVGRVDNGEWSMKKLTTPTRRRRKYLTTVLDYSTWSSWKLRVVEPFLARDRGKCEIWNLRTTGGLRALSRRDVYL